jgi:hypothetical protein
MGFDMVDEKHLVGRLTLPGKIILGLGTFIRKKEKKQARYMALLCNT